VVTHHRLEKSADGGLVPAGRLNEPLVVRPTSETIIGDSFAKWVSSYRDLPILINQWANVVRWEMRTRIFLRTSEFLWQEGHTAHATREEAIERTRMMLEVYADFAETFLAIPVIRGRKTESERFPGAIDTLCIEAMMQDRKALQAGTSHFLGQNFAIASGIRFQNDQEQDEHAWTTSWGSSTRLIGGLIMTHSDDNGLVLPPRIASAHVALMPISRSEEDRARVMEYTNNLAADLRRQHYHGRPVQVEIDQRDIGGARGWDWIKKGIPVRVEIGPKDIEKDAVFVGRRDREARERASIPTGKFISGFTRLLDEIQNNLYQRALDFREAHTAALDARDAFCAYFTPQNEARPEIHGGFAKAPWCGEAACEKQIKDDLNVTIRCMPLDASREEGSCVYCGKPSGQRVIFAKAY
jgi:prolyl-tRNA synthetase